MPRFSARALAFSLLILILLYPALAVAQPHPGQAVFSAAERHYDAPTLLFKIRSLLSVLWGETGSILDPNGSGPGSGSGSGTVPNAAGTGDTGSGLDPNG
jgi:hypothetical protein